MQPYVRVCILALVFCLFVSPLPAQSDVTAVSGVVSGNVQQVGFRAMILKQAICHNLAGQARNLENGTVQFVLQGNTERIEKALKTIRKGTKKSSDVKVKLSPVDVDANLTTFTVIGWTSTSRHITTPYDLVFRLRPSNTSLSKHDSKEIYHSILRATVSPEDLPKLDKRKR
jgi:acylphosphatase